MILSGDHKRIIQTIDRLHLESKQLLKSAIEISWYSRGAWTYEDVLNMSAIERDLLCEFINERLKHASKMTFPVF